MTDFIPGKTMIQNSGMVLDKEDHDTLKKACDSMLICGGPFIKEFELSLQNYFGIRKASFVNSGSSANLLAVTSLEMPKGSEVITCSASFPTTINPIIQNNLVPVLVDCELETWNMDTTKLEEAYSHKTKAVVVTHMLGNPVDMSNVVEFCKNHNLYLMEDMCDAFGAIYDGKMVGTFGHVSTLSFYPAHHITTGEGGAVLTNFPRLATIIESYRDWGRDCWCEPGKDNTCGRRFDGEYDHKFTYSRVGYNLNSTNLQASLGVSQIKKIDSFVEARRNNWNYLYNGLKDLPIMLPSYKSINNPSWFGFAIGTNKRKELAKYLDDKKIGNRPLFAGNIVRQPLFKNVEHRVVGKLTNSNYAMDNVLWIGVWPGITKEMLDYMVEVLHEFNF